MDEVRRTLIEAINSGKTKISDLVNDSELSRATADRYRKGIGIPEKTTIRQVSDFLKRRKLLPDDFEISPSPTPDVPASPDASKMKIMSPAEEFESFIKEVAETNPKMEIGKVVKKFAAQKKRGEPDK